MTKRVNKSQEEIISGFYTSFKEKFYHDASPTGVSSVIQKVIDDKENQHVHDFFVGRSFENLVELLKINDDKVKQEQLAHLNDLIQGLKIGQAENFANKMHSEGLISNDEYLKIWNEQIEVKRAECKAIMEKQKAAELEKALESKEVKAPLAIVEEMDAPFGEAPKAPAKKKKKK